MLQQVVHAGFQAVKICLIKTSLEISDSINLARVQGMNILKMAYSVKYGTCSPVCLLNVSSSSPHCGVN